MEEGLEEQHTASHRENKSLKERFRNHIEPKKAENQQSRRKLINAR
jgi:hypothetical protein